MGPQTWFGPISGPCGSGGSTATMVWSQHSQTHQANPELPQEEGFVQLCPKKQTQMKRAGNRRNDPFHLVHASLCPALPHSSSVRSCQPDVCIPTEQVRELGWMGREYQWLSPLHWGKWLLGAQDQGEPCLQTLVWVIFSISIQ